ncbi:MAG: hypothetical protein M0P70_12430 [Desulfobulbaceae bacterium]|nr:hypothetical protein [Desulfobulbaceae bacterium]
MIKNKMNLARISTAQRAVRQVAAWFEQAAKTSLRASEAPPGIHGMVAPS